MVKFLALGKPSKLALFDCDHAGIHLAAVVCIDDLLIVYLVRSIFCFEEIILDAVAVNNLKSVWVYFAVVGF